MSFHTWLFGQRTRRDLTGRGLGCRPSPKDARDFDYPTAGATTELSLPESVLLKGWSIKNQGRFNSCTAHAVCTAAEILSAKQVPFSERHNWYHARKDYMRTYPANTGAHIRDALKIAQKVGCAPDALCPYGSTIDALNEAPSVLAEGFARFYRIGEYAQCATVLDAKVALNDGFPVVIGMRIDGAFGLTTQVVTMPKAPFGGAHAMVVIGYTPAGFVLLNSWDVLWGTQGRAVLPYEVVQDDDVVFEKYAVTSLKRRDAP